MARPDSGYMVDRSGTPGRNRRWLPWTGVGAALGALVWTAIPWLRRATLGTRPYVGTVFDVGSLGGWLLMAGGLVGFRLAYGDRYGRLGRASVGTTAVGMSLVALLYVRSVLAFVRAGLRPVPATGEDPAGLVLTWAFLLGFGLILAGTGGLGLALRRVDGGLTLTTGLLVLAAVLPAVAVGLRFGAVLPLPVGRLLVGTNVAFVPLGAAWVALGYRVWEEYRR
ncbi:hypothetical protein ACFQE8_10985 [Salinirubellus sp. GCM10025818]|uniref:hypothetical protein n=1 Tax=Salinirubellus TaxID=2162630 RepID=UPI0030CCFE4D